MDIAVVVTGTGTSTGIAASGRVGGGRNEQFNGIWQRVLDL